MVSTTFITQEEAIRSRRNAAEGLRRTADRLDEEADQMEKDASGAIPLVDLSLVA